MLSYTRWGEGTVRRLAGAFARPEAGSSLPSGWLAVEPSVSALLLAEMWTGIWTGMPSVAAAVPHLHGIRGQSGWSNPGHPESDFACSIGTFGASNDAAVQAIQGTAAMPEEGLEPPTCGL
jgi:hypothetical protein